MSSVQVNHPITYTGTASYAGGFNGYPAYSRSGDSLINGTAPALGTVMHSDTRIVFVDVATGGQGTTANNLWDPSEWIFFCSGVAPGGACTTVPATGAFVLYQGIGTRPAAATITKRDAHIDCVCTNNAFAQGQVVIYDYDSTNAAAGVPYDVFLSFTFLFGDGTQTQVSASGTTPSGGFTATTSHSYISPGPVSPKVIVQETGTPSGTPQIGPLSAIVEQGFTGTITVTPPSTGITVNVTCGSATAGKPVTCNATATGGNGGPYTFTWTAPSGSPSTGSGPSFTTTYAVKGTFQVTANATDTASNKGSASVMVTVAPQPIVVTVTCGSATAGKPVTCNASATGGTTPFTFFWSAPGGSPATGTGASFTTTYAAKGTFVVNATATDNNGAKKSQTASIVVAGQPLQATISAACVNALATVTVGKPVTCSATASGGTGPYTFRWTAVGGSPASGTGASFTVSYATKGTFTLTVNATDANNRSAATSVTNFVVSGQPIVVTVTCGTATAGKPVTCNATASGGTSPYTFTWASKGTPATGTGTSYTTTFAAKGSQVINATARDNNAVTKLGQATVVVTAQPIVVTVNCGSATAGKPVTCNASATGGTSPYTFAWSAPGGSPATGSGASFTVTYAAKGTFVVNATATDLNNAKKSQTASIVVAGQPIVVTVTCGTATAGKPVTCNATASGGTAPYTFTWASRGTPATGTGTSYTTTFAAKGSQVVNATARDNNAVTKLGQATVVVAAQPIVVTVTCGAATAGKPVTCNASATGGTSPYTFAWSAPGGSPATGTGASFTTTYATKGSFVVNATATDLNGAKKSGVATVGVASQSFAVTVTCGTATVGKPVTCNASATGGTSPYTFAWSAPGGSPATGTGASFTTTYATKGSFVVNATATDLNGAKKSGVATVGVASQSFAVTVTCGSATAGKPVTCNASASGGSPPFTFSWSAPGGNPATGTGASFTTTYATKGTFVVNATATDANNAKKSATASVVVAGQPIIVTVTCGSATAGKPVTCNASATGGTSPYTFAWSAPGGSPATGTGASFTTTYAVKGTNVVNVTATDGNNAKKSQTATVVVAAQPIVVTVTCGTATVGQPVTCNASATGGTVPYTFTWASRGTPATGTGASYTTTFSTKGPQVINATARDNNAVTKLGQATVNVQGSPLVVTVTCGTATAGKPVTCNASATGGTAPYTFAWSAPGGSPATGTGASFTTTYAAKGTFVVNATATDANSAKKAQTASIVVAGQPIVVTVTCGTATAGKPVTCNASATGGTAPYTFTWASRGTPATGTGASYTTTFAAKGSQVINATARDNNAVTKLGQATVLVTAQPIVVTVTCGTATVGKPVTCNASATGGTSPYTFAWSAPGGTPTTGTGASFTTTYATKGTFVVNATATDLNNVKKSQTASVNVAGQAFAVTVTCGTATAGKPVTCNASASGGTAPFTFTWSAPGGSPSTGSGTSFTTTYAAKGTFVVNATATDTNNSKKSATASVVVTGQPIVVTVTCGTATAGKPVTCNASVTGGTSPYTFSWSVQGGTPATGTGASVTTTYATKGTFVVNATVTDANNIKKSQTASIVVASQPVAVTVSCGSATAGNPVTCNASATGGTGPYTFTWSAPG
ncbi:PKD domain-containing protein, partial [Candidatus Bathyarchaeota archaeon]